MGSYGQFLSRRHNKAAERVMRGEDCPSLGPMEGICFLTQDAIALQLHRSPEG